MVSKKGELATAKTLLASNELQEGFTRLWDCGCLYLTLDAMALQSNTTNYSL